MAAPLSQATVEAALAKLGHYRVTRIQRVALEGPADGVSGALLLAMALRESNGTNVIGGLAYVNPDARKERWDVSHRGGVWVAEWDPSRQDKGPWQISARWNGTALRGMAGVEAGTWGPVIPGATALDDGMVPQFEASLRFTLELLHDHAAQAEDAGAEKLADQVRIGVAAHNCGISGALAGWRAGNVDARTTQGDYSAWIFEHRTRVNHALHTERFDRWRVDAA